MVEWVALLISRATLYTESHGTTLDLEAGRIAWSIKRLCGYLWCTTVRMFPDPKALESVNQVAKHNFDYCSGGSNFSLSVSTTPQSNAKAAPTDVLFPLHVVTACDRARPQQQHHSRFNPPNKEKNASHPFLCPPSFCVPWFGNVLGFSGALQLNRRFRWGHAPSNLLLLSSRQNGP